MSAQSSISTLPAPLRRALTSVAGRRLFARLLVGLATLAVAAVLLLVAQLALDRLLDFARPVRAALLVLDAVVLGVVARRFLYLPWRRRWRAAEAAFAIQRRWPELGSQVISAVQLGPTAPDAPGAGSRPLVDALVYQADEYVSRLPLARVTPLSPSLRRAGLGLLLAGVTAGLMAWQWPLASVLLARAALRDLPLPTATIVMPETRDIRLAMGTSVTLAALADGVLPPQGRIELALDGGERRSLLVQPDAAAPDRYAVTLDNVQQSFSYRFYLGDGRGPVFDVTTQPAPLLERAEFVQEFPAYTGRPPLTQPAGPLTLFPGATVRVTARASQPLGAMQLRFDGDGEHPSLPLTIDTKDSRSALGRFTVPADGVTGLSLPLESADAIPAPDSTIYPVILEADRAPVVSIETPEAAAETIVPTGRLAVRARVSDDFAVGKVELVREIGGVQTRVPLTVGTDGVVTHEFAPSTETPTLSEGIQLTWWIEAADNNNVTGPGIGVSPRKQLGIVSFAQKQQEMLQRLQETSQRVEEVARRQAEIREGLGDALRKLTTPPAPNQ